ncbi:thiocillin family RiPP [Amycolatopsis benzoatilytica]|uniref:thiocillin family RiPP n=1 Tax=Amycolatopsis benzoatilytica TaxID=346045 RepID=UPI000369F004|nr:thiocillin family RiPP [Amycolatopsis benzoatilytica]
MTPETQHATDLPIDDLTVEELSEVGGAASASTAGTISTPATVGTAACLGG